MLNIAIPNYLAKRLKKLAKETYRSNSFYVYRAIEEFLDEHEDYLIAQVKYNENRPRILYERAKSMIGFGSI